MARALIKYEDNPVNPGCITNLVPCLTEEALEFGKLLGSNNGIPAPNGSCPIDEWVGVDCTNPDDNYMKFVGYTESNENIQRYFSRSNIKWISKEVTRLLRGTDPQGRDIVVPDDTIGNVLSSVYESYRPPTVDIYSRYTIPSGINQDDYVRNMINRTLEIIVNDVQNNIGMEEANKKLSIWTTLLGNFNEHQIRSHPILKMRHKRPDPMQFNMNY